jgi:plastocyanin
MPQRDMQQRVRWLILFLCLGITYHAVAADSPGSEGPIVLSTDPDGVQRLTMILDSYEYRPKHIVVQAGRPVELILTSVTTLTPHNFILKEESSGLSLDQEVGAGKTATIKFTPMHKGRFPFYCDKKLLFFASHREKGMEGTLEVR